MSDDSERGLVLRTRAGEIDAFGELVLRHQARLRAFAAKYVDSSDDVYDLVQDTFVQAFHSLERFDADRDFGRWLRGICRNRILKHYREVSNRSKRLEVIATVLEDRLRWEAMEDDGAIDRVEAIKACVEELPSDRRDLLLARHVYEQAVKDMAAQLGKSAAAVSVSLMRIRATVRACAERRLRQAP